MNQNPFPEEADSDWSTGVMEKGVCVKILMLERFYNTPLLHHCIIPRTVKVGRVVTLKARPNIKAK